MAAGGAASGAAITVLETLYANGPLTYRELKALSGFAPKAESGKFAYFLRKLLRHCLVSLDRQAKRYSITGAGRACLGGLGRGAITTRRSTGPRAVPAEGLGSAEARILHILDTAGPQGHPGLRRLAGFEGGGGAALFAHHVRGLLGTGLASLDVPQGTYSITGRGRAALGRRP